MGTRTIPIHQLPVELDRDIFLRTLIRELAGTLEDVVGLEEASGLSVQLVSALATKSISVTGRRWASSYYRSNKWRKYWWI